MIRKSCLILIIIIISIGIHSCKKETPFEKRSRFLNSYINETFPEFDLVDGEYLFILPGGCAPCKKSMLFILNNQTTLVNERIKGVLLSKNTQLLYREINFLQFKNILIDKKDKIDNMSFGIFGISMLKIEKGSIIGSKSLTTDDYKKGFEYFLSKPY